MNIKKQILLGSKDVISKNNEDEFLNIQISRATNELRTDSVENKFDLTQQYTSERNSSLRFALYGIVESKYSDCTDVTLTITTNDNTVMYLPKITQGNIVNSVFEIPTNPLSDSNELSTNLFSFAKASYNFMFEINKDVLNAQILNAKNAGTPLSNKSLIVSVKDNAKNLYDIFEIPFLYFDSNGDLMPFGIQDATIDLSGNTIQINNDFPFFYDRHWVKFNLNISKNGLVFFPELKQKQTVPENITGGTTTFDITLDFPSKFGIEEATVVIDSANLNGNLIPQYIFTPQTFKWNIGEQVKQVSVGIIDDTIVDNTESVFFTFTNLVNCRLKDTLTSKLELDILNTNVPSQVNFLTSQITVKEDQGVLPINIVFDKPIEIQGQSFDLYFDASLTNAIVDKDFIMRDDGVVGDKKKTIFLNEGDTGVTTQIIIVDNVKYDLDKTIVLVMSGLTTNIIVGNINPNFTITIKDTMNILYTDYVIPVNYGIGFGVYETNTQNDLYDFVEEPQNPTGSNVVNKGFSKRDRNFYVKVVNDGEDVLYGNQIIKKGQSMFFNQITGLTDSLTYTLPSNDTLDIPNKVFKKTKYSFSFVGIYYDQAFIGGGPPFGYPDLQVALGSQSASTVGNIQVYLVSDVTNINTNASGLTNIKINGTLFLPPPPNVFSFTFTPPTQTKINSFFSDRLVEIENKLEAVPFSTDGTNYLPFGINFVTNKTVSKEKYVNLNFGNLFTQIGYLNLTGNTSSLNYSTLRTESKKPINDNSSFFNWSDTNIITKTSLELHIRNTSFRSFNLFANQLRFNSEFFIKQGQIDFANPVLQLPANSDYKTSGNTYNSALYELSLKNIMLFDKDDNFIGKMDDINIDEIDLPAGLSAAIPNYYLTSEYTQVDVASNGFSTYCETKDVKPNTNIFYFQKTVDVYGLLFTESKSAFSSASFGTVSVVPDCPTAEIKFKII